MDYFLITKFKIKKVFSNHNLNNLINKYFQVQIKQTKLLKIIKIKWNCKKMNNFYYKMLNKIFQTQTFNKIFCLIIRVNYLNQLILKINKD